MVGHQLERHGPHLGVVVGNGQPAALHFLAQRRRHHPRCIGTAVGSVGTAHEGAEQRASPLHRHGDEIDAPRLVVVTDTTAKHRGLLLASEGLVLCEGFLVHGGGVLVGGWFAWVGGFAGVFFAAVFFAATVLWHRWTGIGGRRRLAHRSLEGDREELLCFDGELHGELVEHVLGIAVDDEADGFLGGDATLVAVEELVLVDLRGSGFVLDGGGVVVDVHVGEGVGAALTAQQEGVAGRIVACSISLLTHPDESSVGVLRLACRDALGDDGGTGVLADVYHLRAGVGLLMIVGDRH